ncbi:MAG: glycosyltransferase [Hespellia sp.]|nr:glycosyltransferase [Hespellia sp.]
MSKVLIVVSAFWGIGGISTSVINMCHELVQQDNDVHFLNMGDADRGLLEKLPNEVKVLELKGFAQNWNLSREKMKAESGIVKGYKYIIGAIKKLTNKNELWLRIVFKNAQMKEDYDLAVAFMPCAPTYYFLIHCVNTKKKVGFVHGELKHLGDISSWDRYFEKMNFIACVSNAVRDEFRKKYATISEKFITVYNMFDAQNIEEMSKLECKSNFDKHLINIATISRIENSTKRIDRIPQICKILIEKGVRKFHWYIIGGGEDEDADKRLAVELHVDAYIDFVGIQKNPYPYIFGCDFTVLTSLTESFGMAVLESQILQTPVISTKYPAVYEIIENQVSGIIADQNIKDIADKVETLIRDETLRNRIRKNLSQQRYSNQLPYSQLMGVLDHE